MSSWFPTFWLRTVPDPLSKVLNFFDECEMMEEVQKRINPKLRWFRRPD
jgi:hypothetical protein